MRRLAEQARVFFAEGDGAARRFRRMQHDVAVHLVELRLEESVVHGLEKRRGFNLHALRIKKGFSQRRNHGGDEEIAAQLERVRAPGMLGDDGDAAAELLQQRTNFFDGSRCPAGRGPQLAGLGDMRTPKNRRRHILLPAAMVLLFELLRERDAQRAHCDMHRAFGQSSSALPL